MGGSSILHGGVSRGKKATRQRSLLLLAGTVLALLLAGEFASPPALAADTREVTFSCRVPRGEIVSTILVGHQTAVIRDCKHPGHTVELERGWTYRLDTSCVGDDECRFFISIKGARFDPDGDQTDGTLSPGDSTSARFVVD